MSATPLFGVVAPGRGVLTDFQTCSETRAVTMLADPCSIAELTFFLLPTTPVPPGYGAILYYSAPPSFDAWQVSPYPDPHPYPYPHP